VGEKEREDSGTGVAIDRNVHTALSAGILQISIFDRIASEKTDDWTGLYGDFEKRVKFGFSRHTLWPTELRNRQILLQFPLVRRAT